MSGKEIRRTKLFSNGKPTIAAIDQGQTFGPIPGLIDLKDSVNKLKEVFYPGPVVDVELTNDYPATASKNENLFPLMIAGINLMPEEKIRRRILQDGFLGYKVFLKRLQIL